MAEPDGDELELKPADAGTAFRLEMYATNLVLGYWKHAVAAVVVVLLTVLAWGQYRDWYRRDQRTTTSAISKELAKLPKPFVALSEDLAQGTAVDPATVEPVGDALVAIANGARGAAATEARMAAAEAYRIAGRPEKQREALDRVAAADGGLFGFAASAALANLDLEEGKGEDAVARLQKLSTEDGYLGEQATIDLGLAYEALDRKADAAQTYRDFATRFPNSKRQEEVAARLARVQ